PRTQDRLLALGRRPDRPGLIGPSDHARGGAARAEGLDAAAQSVESLHARVVHDGAVAAEGPAPERIEGGARRGPRGRRIEHHRVRRRYDPRAAPEPPPPRAPGATAAARRSRSAGKPAAPKPGGRSPGPLSAPSPPCAPAVPPG